MKNRARATGHRAREGKYAPECALFAAVSAIAASSTGSAQKDWKHEPLSALIEHIVQRHHQFTREVFSNLQPVTDALLEDIDEPTQRWESHG